MEAPAPRSSWWSHPLVKRLPVLLIAAVGIWLFRTGYLPKERELIWTVDRPADVRSFEVELWNDSELLKREELTYPQGAPRTITERVSLGSGDYRIEAFLRYAGQNEPRHLTVPLKVGGDKQYFLRAGP